MLLLDLRVTVIVLSFVLMSKSTVMIVSFSNLDVEEVRLKIPALHDESLQSCTLWDLMMQKNASLLPSAAKGEYRSEDFLVEVFSGELNRFVECSELSLKEILSKQRQSRRSKHMRVSMTALDDASAGGAIKGKLAIAGKAFALKDGGFMPLTINESPEVCLELRFPDLNDAIQRDSLDGKTGLSTWDASICLAQFLSLPKSRQGILKGKHILELGAGTGVVGISSACLGVSSVQLTDLSYTLDNLRRNVELNANANNNLLNMDIVSVRELDWNNPDTYSSISTGPVDVILASDVAWLEHLVTPLANTITSLIRSTGAVMYLSHQTRSTGVDDALFGALAELSIEEIPQSEYHPEYSSDKIKIFRLAPKDL